MSSKFSSEVSSFFKKIHQRVGDEELKKIFSSDAYSVEDFRKIARRATLIQALRERNFKWMTSIFQEIATEHPDITIWKGLSSIHPDELADILPLKQLTGIYQMMGVDISIKTSHKIFAFNELYEELLMNMITAFNGNVELLNEFVEEAFFSNQPSRVADLVNPLVMEHANSIMSIQMGKSTEHPFMKMEFFNQLPYVQRLNLKKYWKKQIEENQENYAYVQKTVSVIVGTMLGLPMGVFNDSFFGEIKQQIMGVLDQTNKDQVVNQDGSVNMQFIMDTAAKLMQGMEESGFMGKIQKSLENESFDVDINVIRQLTNGMELPPDVQLMLEAASVNSSDPFESKKNK
jgi:hypothetical protein